MTERVPDVVTSSPRDSLKSHYDDYYGSIRLAKWRELSARDKATNVTTLWSATHSGAPTVVDIGCGEGSIIQELGRLGFGQSYMGFEISESGVVQAQQRQYTKPTRFEVFDGMSIPVPNKSFDLAILSHVLEHVESPRHLLREAARVATYVFVEVPLELNVRTPRDFSWTEVGHINLYTPLLIRHLMQSVGLRVLAERVTCPSRAVFRFQRPRLKADLHWALKAGLLRLWPALAWRGWTYHGCLIAKSSEEYAHAT